MCAIVTNKFIGLNLLYICIYIILPRVWVHLAVFFIQTELVVTFIVDDIHHTAF